MRPPCVNPEPLDPLDCAVAVILAAAGSGARLAQSAGASASELPKQWRTLGSVPLLAHAFRFFDSLPQVVQIVLALDSDGIARARDAESLRSQTGKTVRCVPGGASRQESVWNALRELEPAPDIVLIHDAARPFPPLRPVERCIALAREAGGAILARRVVETIKRAGADLEVVETIDRRSLWAAQTPQGFCYGPLLEAYRAAESELERYTDDAAIFEANGGRVRIVESTAANFKITVSEDFARAERLLAGGDWA